MFPFAYVVTDLELPTSWALTGILSGATPGIALVRVADALSDRRGRKPVHRAGTWIGLLVAFPVAEPREREPALT